MFSFSQFHLENRAESLDLIMESCSFLGGFVFLGLNEADDSPPLVLVSQVRLCASVLCVFVQMIGVLLERCSYHIPYQFVRCFKPWHKLRI